MKRRKFITTCACCAAASCAAFLANQNKPVAEAVNTKDFNIERVEIHIAEHCNLNCKYCGHFSSVAQKEFYDLDKFKKDIERMSYVFNKKLSCIQLLGGEPLLNPQINEYIKNSKIYFPNTSIDILTNAILLDNMDEAFWKTVKENDVRLLPSIYPIKINWKSILDKAKKYDVEIYGNVLTGEKLTLDNIEKFKVRAFFKLELDEKGGGEVSEIIKCKPKFAPLSMYNGKLYPCYATAYIRHLNKKFNTNFTVTKDDYIDLYKAKDISDIQKFTQTQVFPFCRKYCKQISGKLKWERADEHFLSEWT